MAAARPARGRERGRSATAAAAGTPVSAVQTRGRFPFSARAVALVVVSIIALALAYQLKSAALLAFATLCAVVVVASWALLFLGSGAARVDRTTRADRLHVGERTRVSVAITDTSTFPRAPGQWRDRTSSGLVVVHDDDNGGWSAPSRGSRTRVSHYTVAAVRRGRQRLGPLDVAFQDPFGLVTRRGSRGDALTITVLPELVPLSALAPLLSAHGDGVAQRPEIRAGAGDDDVIARPYHVGDSIRRVNWRASAHHDELMVRQEEQENAPRTVLFLDTAERRWAGRSDARGDSPAFERGVSLVASFAKLLSETGYNVQLVSEAGLDLEIDGTLTNAGLEQALFALATITPQRVATEFSALESVLRGQSAKSVVAVFGALDDDAADEVAGLARLSGSATAFLPNGISESARARLESAGWSCRDADDASPRRSAPSGPRRSRP